MGTPFGGVSGDKPIYFSASLVSSFQLSRKPQSNVAQIPFGIAGVLILLIKVPLGRIREEGRRAV